MGFYALTEEANSLIKNQIDYDKAREFNDFIYKSKYKTHELVEKYKRSFAAFGFTAFETKFDSFTLKEAKLLLNLFEVFLIDKEFEE